MSDQSRDASVPRPSHLGQDSGIGLRHAADEDFEDSKSEGSTIGVQADDTQWGVLPSGVQLSPPPSPPSCLCGFFTGRLVSPCGNASEDDTVDSFTTSSSSHESDARAAGFGGVWPDRQAGLSAADSQPPSSRPADVSHLHDAIRRSDSGAVEEILQTSTIQTVIDELTTLKGLRCKQETAIMCASRHSNARTFSAVLAAMTEELTDSQVEKALRARDDDEKEIATVEEKVEAVAAERTHGEAFATTNHYKRLLVMVAVEGGKLDVFRHVLKRIGGLVTFNCALLRADDQKNAAFLAFDENVDVLRLMTGAARGGCLKIFRRIMKTEIAQEILLSQPHSVYGLSLLLAAARGGSVEVFDEVSDILGDRIYLIIQGRSVRGYTILMAAARSGSAAMVEAVMRVLADRLTHSEVEHMLQAVAPCFGYTTFLAAVRSGNLEGVSAIVRHMENYLAEHEVLRMIKMSELLGASALVVACISTTGATYMREVLKLLEERMPKEEVSGIVAAKGWVFWTLLMEAVQSGHLALIETAMRILSDYLEEDEIKGIILKPLKGGETLIMTAARGVRVEAVEAVLGMMQSRLTRQEMKDWVQLKDTKDRTVLMMAVYNSNRTDVIDAAVNVVTTVLSREEVNNMVNTKDKRGHTILTLAVLGGRIDVIDAVAKILTTKATPEQGREMMRADAGIGWTLLMAAASARTDVFEAVAKLLTIWLKDEVQEVIKARLHSNETLLSEAVRCGDVGVIRAVVKFADDSLLTSQEVKDIIEEKDATLLITAVSTRKSAVVGAVLDIVESKLEDDEVRNMLQAEDRRQGTILAAAVKSGNIQVFEAVRALLAPEASGSRLHHEEVKRMIVARDQEQKSILRVAVESGRTDVCDALLFFMYDVLGEAALKREVEREDAISFQGLNEAMGRGRCQVECVARVMKLKMDAPKVNGELMKQNDRGDYILMAAVRLGSGEVVDAVAKVLKDYLTSEQMTRMVTDEDRDHVGIFLAAILSGGRDVVQVVANLMGSTLKKYEIWDMTLRLAGHGRLSTAADEMKAVALDAIAPIIIFKLRRRDQVLPMTTKEHRQIGIRILCKAGKIHDRGGVEALIASFKKLAKEKVNVTEELKGAFDARCGVLLRPPTKNEWSNPSGNTARVLQEMSVLLQHGINPGKENLVRLCRSFQHDLDLLQTCFGDAMVSACNIFIPGMTLSIALADAADSAVEGERRDIQHLQKGVDDLLMEVLEYLPRTVNGFPGGLRECTTMLEPEDSGVLLCEIEGPLALALRRRQHMKKFCVAPLLLDFMDRNFSLGLPRLRSKVYKSETKKSGGDDAARIGDEVESKGFLDVIDVDTMAANHLEVTLPFGNIGRMLQGYGDGAGLLPGGQFILTGLIAKPCMYYAVPAMRMVLDVVLYLAMLVLFGIALVFQDFKELTPGEIAFAIYIVGVVCTEASEIWRGYHDYIRDHWNVLDVLSIILSSSGFIVRCVDQDEAWGRYLYALSAPLVFTRILFFAQILPDQGPMVIFSMAGELLTFGVVMVVVMLGFAISFYILVQNVMGETVGTVWLTVFKAIFGDLAAFDEFSDEEFDVVFTVLFVLYLIIMTIMLLNLLVAVLSTAHSRVHENIDTEFKISKARMIEHYRKVVERNALPSPFNLLSLPFWILENIAHPCRAKDEQLDVLSLAVRRYVGKVVFWLVLGPFAIIAMTLLSIVSVPKVMIDMYTQNSRWKRAGKMLLVIPCSLVLVPLCLSLIWLGAPLWYNWENIILLTSRCKSLCKEGGPSANARSAFPENVFPPGNLRVGDVLKRIHDGLSVSKLRSHLDDPVSHPFTPRSDGERRLTTVENAKHVEKDFARRMEQWRDELDEKIGTVGEEILAAVSVLG